MERFKRTLMIVISSLLLAISSVPCSAADSAISDPGGPAETPSERALLVFTSNSSDQLDYLSSDAATDALRAVNSTAARAAKSLIAIENGSVTISFPAISPDFQGNIAKGFAGMIVKAELISGTF